MLEAVDGSAEPWFAPLWRFGRTVMLIDLALGLVVVMLSTWQGWTSVAESWIAILVGGGVLAGIGLLPVLGPIMGPALVSIVGMFAGGGYDTAGTLGHQTYPGYPDTTRDDRSPGMLRFSALLITAGLLAIAYALAVKTLFA